MKRISGAEYPLAKIFSSEFDYSIPSYQRPYAWTETEAGELFSDLHDFFVKESDDSYFLGSIVLIKEEGKPHAEVIDGQQRLTTLTILLAALTAGFGEQADRDDFAGYICEPGRASQGLEPKPRLSLRERDRRFFADYVQSLKLRELVHLDPAQLENEAQRNIRRNTEVLIQNLNDKFGDDAARRLEFGSFLVQQCFLVAVSTPSQQSAFRVFSVLNSRGLDLLPTDIIKSDIIGGIDAARQKDFTEIWEELEVRTGRDGFAELFGHIRMIYAKDKARRALLEEFRERVIKKAPSSEHLITNVIEPFADAYLIAKRSCYVATSNAGEVNSLFGWLNRIDNSDWLPPAMKFLSDSSSDPGYALWFFRKLERLAAYMHVCGRTVNQRIERFASVLQALECDHSIEKPPEEVELTKTEKEEMRRTIGGDVYFLTARRRSYLILRLDSFISDSAAVYDPSLLTIEHVLPQTVNEDSEWAAKWPDGTERQTWLHRVANLVPLTQRRNSKAQNYDFDRKKAAYFGGRHRVSSYTLTTQVLSLPEWTPEVVQQRQAYLVGLLAEKWELNS